MMGSGMDSEGGGIDGIDGIVSQRLGGGDA